MSKTSITNQLQVIERILNTPFSELTELDYEIHIKDMLSKYGKHISYRQQAYKNTDPVKLQQYRLRQKRKRNDEKIIRMR